MRLAVLAFLALAASAQAQMKPPAIPADPDIWGDKVVYSAEGDLWLGDLGTRQAQRITTWPGVEARPRFSPDGKWIGFTGTYEGKPDLYRIPAGGGTPERWTFNPTRAELIDWLPDGSGMVYRSNCRDPFGVDQLFTVSAPGAFPYRLPLPAAGNGVFSADSDTLYYTRNPERSNVWVKYRGGQQNDIIAWDVANQTGTKIIASAYDESQPILCAGSLWFVSDKDGGTNLYRYDLKSKKTLRITAHEEFGVLSVGADASRLAFRFKSDLFLVDPTANKVSPIAMNSTGDRIHTLAHEVPIEPEQFSLGPAGKRLAVIARGRLFTVPEQEGEIRQVAPSGDALDRKQLPSWSPNGAQIAYVSDRSGEWNVWLASADGTGTATQLTKFEKVPIEAMMWSPNSDYLLLTDMAGNLWKVDAKTGAQELIAHGALSGIETFDIGFNGRFIAYVMPEAFNSGSVFVHDNAEKKTVQITRRPHADADVAFDKSGRVLYIAGNRSVSMEWDAFDFQMNAGAPMRLFMATLTADTPNPFAPKLDEEGAPKEEGPNPVLQFDLAGAPNRLIPLAGPMESIRGLGGGKNSVFFLSGGSLKQFTLEGKAVKDLGSGIAGYVLNAKGDKLAALQGGRLITVDAGAPVEGKAAPTAGWSLTVNPKQEWRQMIVDAWRFIRDSFYDPKLHGADWDFVLKRALGQLEAVGHRSEVTEIIAQMQAEVNVSHMFGGGGYSRFGQPSKPSAMGVLGCELAVDGSKVVVQSVFRGDGFFEDGSISPLAAVGVDVREGDTILSINGNPLDGVTDPQKFLESSARKLTKLVVQREGSDPRTVWVTPLASDRTARYQDWVGSREAIVARRAKNMAYIHVPNMGEEGMAEFTKRFYANLDKDGIVLDVRSNGGGITSGMVLERLRRAIFEYDQGRYGAPVPYHRMGFLGKVVAVCDDNTASDGEYFLTGFRQLKLGPTVGTRTWGGFVAVGGKGLIDGGFVSCPQQGSFAPDLKWLPDGYGFKPDYEVEQDPTQVALGGDPQLEKAIALLADLIKKDPPKRPGRQIPPIKDWLGGYWPLR